MGTTVAITTSAALALLERNLSEFGEIGLNEAQNFDDETLEAAGRFSAFSEDHAAAIRLAVGASLTARRDGAAQGEWGIWLTAYGAAIGRSIDSLNRWMSDAQEHYSIEPPKGARRDRGQHPHGAEVDGLGQRPTLKGVTGEKIGGAEILKDKPGAGAKPKPSAPKPVQQSLPGAEAWGVVRRLTIAELVEFGRPELQELQRKVAEALRLAPRPSLSAANSKRSPASAKVQPFFKKGKK